MLCHSDGYLKNYRNLCLTQALQIALCFDRPNIENPFQRILLGHSKSALFITTYRCTATWRGLQGDNLIVHRSRTCKLCPQILSASRSNPLFESYQISGDTPVVVVVRCVHVSCGFNLQGCHSFTFVIYREINDTLLY